MGADTIEVGGYKLPKNTVKRAEKVRIYLSGEELALVDIIMEKLKYSTRPPVFRYMLYHYDDLEKAIKIVEGYTQLREKQNNFNNLFLNKVEL